MSCSACRSAYSSGQHDGANRVEPTGEEDDGGEAEQRDHEQADGPSKQSAARAC